MSFLDVTTLDEFLARYANQLGARAQDAVDPIHKPDRDPIDLPEFLRPPLPAQGHVITAGKKGLRRQKALLLTAEMGTGKSFMGAGICHAHANGRPYNALVMCPGQLVKKWERELRISIPGVVVHHIKSWQDAFKIQPNPDAPTWWIVGRDRCKLGSFWEPRIINRRGAAVCPNCGNALRDSQGNVIHYGALPKSKLYCDSLVDTPHKKKDYRRCGAALWTYVRKAGAKDRWAPSSAIKKKRRHCIDYLVLDEVHELKGSDTAQANAMGELASVSRKVVALTGTLTGGSAEHLRPLLFRLKPDTLVDEGFGFRRGIMEFNERYGRVETRVTERESVNPNAMSRGSSRSQSKSVRPGIMPTLFGRHLMGVCIFLSLQEVADRLPELSEITVPVALDDHIAFEYARIEKDIREAIKQLGPNDRRLLGPMLHALLCYPDHQQGWETIGYWDTNKITGQKTRFVPVVQPASMPQDTILRKEKSLLDTALNEYSLGRKLWVYVQYTDRHDVAARLRDLFRMHGLRTEVLRSSVKPEDREDWIHHFGPKCDVVISHADLVKTGLDFFDHEGRYNFPSLAFYETGYSLFTLRQAARRAWRIGQPRNCKVFYFYYMNTMQELAVALMGKKMAAALALEGQFSSEGLVAMNEDESMELALAKSLVEQMDDLDAARAWKPVEEATKASVVGNLGDSIDVDALFAELAAISV